MEKILLNIDDLNSIQNDIEMNKISLNLQMSITGTLFLLMSIINTNMCEKIFGDLEVRIKSAKYYIKHFILNKEIFYFLESKGYITQSLDYKYFLNIIYNQSKRAIISFF